jgi:diguanylate cyclase (GGDEF)-like protein
MQELRLPVPPAAVAKAIELAADPNCDIQDLTNVVRMSPVLSAQLLKAVNSPYYGLSRKISTVDRAISYMGIRAVRNILLCFGVQDLSPKKTKYPLDRFWEGSLRRAIAAVTLAKRTGAKSIDNILTLGLCQDLGLLIGITKNEQVEEALSRVSRAPGGERLAKEEELGVSHVEIGCLMFEQWQFPRDMTEAVKWHHHPESAPDEVKESARIADAAESMADLMEVEDKKDCLAAATAKLERLGINSGVLSEIVDEVGVEVGKAAEMLNIKVGVQPSYQDIVKAASEGLFALNLSYESLTNELKTALEQQEKMAKRLEELNAELEKQAMTDKLTGLPNRRAFDENLEKEVSRAGRIREPCSLLLMDIDHFKRFNDTHGHQVGDSVLESVGKTIAKQVRTCDLPARYGGEEFAVIMPHTPQEGAQIAAERIRKAVESTKVLADGKTLLVTISIGVATITDFTERRAGVAVLRRADDALYDAKAGGRNCVRAL